MKKKICLLLVICFLCSAMIPMAAKAAPRIRTISPGLSISGNTANCSLSVSCDYSTDEISATIKLWRGSGCVTTWYRSAEGYLSFYDTNTIIPGQTYTLTADVIINGEAYPTVSVSDS